VHALQVQVGVGVRVADCDAVGVPNVGVGVLVAEAVAVGIGVLVFTGQLQVVKFVSQPGFTQRPPTHDNPVAQSLPLLLSQLAPHEPPGVNPAVGGTLVAVGIVFVKVLASTPEQWGVKELHVNVVPLAQAESPVQAKVGPTTSQYNLYDPAGKSLIVNLFDDPTHATGFPGPHHASR